jgi:hypothetical protein
VWISSMTTSRQTSWLFLLYIIYYCSSSTSTYFTPYTIIRSVHCGDPYYPSNNKRGTDTKFLFMQRLLWSSLLLYSTPVLISCFNCFIFW